MFNINKFIEINKYIKKEGKKTKIIAISKNHEFERVDSAMKSGVKIFGDNRVQEANLKFSEIKKKDNSIELHLTGPLQTNKVKLALDLFDIFHTLDREKLVKELSKYPDKIKNKFFFIQVNTGKE